MPRPQRTPYARLGDHLAARGAAGEARVVLTFAAIEAIIDRALPPYARTPGGVHGWWGRSGRFYYAWEGWLRHGWRVAAVDLAAETATFARGAG
jgi:hypothetical protein